MTTGIGASRSPGMVSGAGAPSTFATRELRALLGDTLPALMQASAPKTIPVLYVGGTAWECRPVLAKPLETQAFRLGEQWDRLKKRERNRRGGRLFAKIMRAQVIEARELRAYLNAHPHLWDEMTQISMPALLLAYADLAEPGGG
jgi:hypothetical protein